MSLADEDRREQESARGELLADELSAPAPAVYQVGAESGGEALTAIVEHEEIPVGEHPVPLHDDGTPLTIEEQIEAYNRGMPGRPGRRPMIDVVMLRVLESHAKLTRGQNALARGAGISSRTLARYYKALPALREHLEEIAQRTLNVLVRDEMQLALKGDVEARRFILRQRDPDFGATLGVKLTADGKSKGGDDLVEGSEPDWTYM